MKPPDTPEPQQKETDPDAAQHVTEAQSLLKTLRSSLETHPELDEAIEKLELALSILTTKSGGLL